MSKLYEMRCTISNLEEKNKAQNIEIKRLRDALEKIRDGDHDASKMWMAAIDVLEATQLDLY